MTPQEFVTWFKGFVEGAHEYNITPAQWDLLKDKVKEVYEDTDYTSAIRGYYINTMKNQSTSNTFDHGTETTKQLLD